MHRVEPLMSNNLSPSLTIASEGGFLQSTGNQGTDQSEPIDVVDENGSLDPAVGLRELDHVTSLVPLGNTNFGGEVTWSTSGDLCDYPSQLAGSEMFETGYAEGIGETGTGGDLCDYPSQLAGSETNSISDFDEVIEYLGNLLEFTSPTTMNSVTQPMMTSTEHQWSTMTPVIAMESYMGMNHMINLGPAPNMAPPPGFYQLIMPPQQGQFGPYPQVPFLVSPSMMVNMDAYTGIPALYQLLFPPPRAP